MSPSPPRLSRSFRFLSSGFASTVGSSSLNARINAVALALSWASFAIVRTRAVTTSGGSGSAPSPPSPSPPAAFEFVFFSRFGLFDAPPLRVWVADDVPDVALGAEAATIPFFPHPQRLLRALLLLAETLALSPSRGSKHSKPDVGRPQFRADGRVRPRRSRHRARGPRGRSSSRARRIVVRALAAAARVVARPVRGGVDDAAGLEPDAARWPVGHARGVTPRGDAASE